MSVSRTVNGHNTQEKSTPIESNSIEAGADDELHKIAERSQGDLPTALAEREDLF